MNAMNIVCLPTYNEKENLENIITAILEAADVHVLVVDDNSPDGTGEIADKLASDNDRIHVLHRQEKAGLGRAYLAAFQEALNLGANKIIQMDADFSHPVSMLPQLLEATDHADLAIASRYVKGGGTKNWPLSRQLISKGGSFYSRTILGVSIRDLTGGFKCWRREVLEELLSQDIQITGFGFQIEMNYRTAKLGFKVVELPYIFIEREAGTSKMSGGIFTEALGMVWQLRMMKVPVTPAPHPRSVAS